MYIFIPIYWVILLIVSQQQFLQETRNTNLSKLLRQPGVLIGRLSDFSPEAVIQFIASHPSINKWFNLSWPELKKVYAGVNQSGSIRLL